MNREIRIGIVGCGHIAALHAEILSKIDGCRLVAAADPDFARAQALADMYGAQAYDTLAEMLSGRMLDAVHITAPSGLHARMARQCADKGVAVYLEKPAGITRDDLDQLGEIAGEVPLGVCFQNRYIPSQRKALQILAGGSLGRLRGARAFISYRRDVEYYRKFPWRRSWEEAGGGALINQAVLNLDVIAEAMGTATSCRAHMENHTPDLAEVEDTFTAYIDFEGKPAILYCTSAYSETTPPLLEFHCDKGRLRLEGELLTVIRPDGQADVVQTGRPPQSWHHSDLASGHREAIGAFYAALHAGEDIPLGIREVRPTLELMQRLYEEAGRREIRPEIEDLTWGRS